jgi:hypothetical protein
VQLPASPYKEGKPESRCEHVANSTVALRHTKTVELCRLSQPSCKKVSSVLSDALSRCMTPPCMIENLTPANIFFDIRALSLFGAHFPHAILLPLREKAERAQRDRDEKFEAPVYLCKPCVVSCLCVPSLSAVVRQKNGPGRLPRTKGSYQCRPIRMVRLALS